MKRPIPKKGLHVHIDLHLHSDLSDGYYNTRELADILYTAGVDYAVLTDHMTAMGLQSFHKYASRHGISVFSGAEMHGDFDNKELHILAYGFATDNEAVNDIIGGTHNVSKIFDTIHHAGGIAVLAHPLNYGWGEKELQTAVGSLVKQGLDGIEAFYKAYDQEKVNMLTELADRHNIVCSGGSDFHGNRNGSDIPGVQMPVSRWKSFRKVLGDHAVDKRHVPPVTGIPTEDPGIRINWKWLFLRIVLPSLMVIGFFIMLIFSVLIPRFEKLLLERKKETTTELTNSAWSILNDYQREVNEGGLSLRDAQNAAIERIRHLRYGPDLKDYFWITDMYATMIMHPYRTDLEGTDVSEFMDPDGVKVFIEFVNKVQQHNSGYVRYIWQWQDDPDRMEAKESYVRGFEDWGWIIGTGLYIDDVQLQIDELTRSMIDISFIVVIISSVLLVLIVAQSMKLEQKRSEAEQKLRLSHERYRALVESSSTGTLLITEGRFVFANYTLLNMLDYTAREMAFLDLHDIIFTKDSRNKTDIIDSIIDGAEIEGPLEIRLKRKDSNLIPALLSSNTLLLSGKKTVILSIQDITRHHVKQESFERDRLLSRLQTSLLYLTEPVSGSMLKPVICGLENTIFQAVRLMNKNDSGALLVVGPKNELLGIITDHDIRARVVGARLDLQGPVSSIMSSPVINVYEDTPVFEAILLQHEKKINHLVITDLSNKPSGIIHISQMLKPEQYSPVVLTHNIRSAKSLDELAEYYERLPVLIGSLLETGALPQNISQVVSTISDSIANRIIGLILSELGPPPGNFAVIVLGSEARKEQTLATDQDNALIYGDGSPEGKDYFMKFGEMFCDGLNTAGYKYCRGGNMSNNKKWNQPLRKWKLYYEDWMSEPEGEALSFCNVFFDQRCIYGDLTLLSGLRKHISDLNKENPSFLSFMALNTLKYKVPLGLFGRIITKTDKEQENTFNIKDAMLPLVNFARLYAFKHDIEETNTLERLEHLNILKVFQEESYRAVIQAYSHLMQLRFSHQVEMIKNGKEADNLINPSHLTQMDEAILKNSLYQISIIQKKLSYDFHIS